MITMNTNQYRFNHGREPRGRGRWAFQVGSETYFCDGTYTQAKRKAVAQARMKGERTVVVLP